MKNKSAQQLGRLGGKKKSEAKTEAARANGAKGGRPTLCAYICQTNNGDGWINVGQAGSKESAQAEAKQQLQWLKDDEITTVQVRVNRYELA